MVRTESGQRNSKERILQTATNLFACYGFHATTTRMIAKEAGIDISTLHYHWGDKLGLYIETLLEMNKKHRELHRKVEQEVQGKPLEIRIATAVHTMADFYFSYPQYAKLAYQVCFTTYREGDERLEKAQKDSLDLIRDIAYFAFHLGPDKEKIPRDEVLSIMGLVELLSLYVTGEECFCNELGFSGKEYKASVERIVVRLFALLYNQGIM